MRDHPDESRPHAVSRMDRRAIDLRVVIADDHAAMRAALRAVISGMKGVVLAGEATSGPEALELIRLQQPDVALVDIRLVGISGLQVAERAWAFAPDTAIVLMAMPSEALFAGGLPAGIAGLVAKEASATELPAALQAVTRGKRFISPSLMGERSSSPPATGDRGGAAWADE